VTTLLAQHLQGLRTRLSYRFLFSPGTIGPIAWLARNEARLGLVKHGLVVAGVGDSGGLTYKKSRRGNFTIDRAMAHVLKHGFDRSQIMEFEPYGYDERQFCSPAFDMPVGLAATQPVCNLSAVSYLCRQSRFHRAAVSGGLAAGYLARD